MKIFSIKLLNSFFTLGLSTTIIVLLLSGIEAAAQQGTSNNYPLIEESQKTDYIEKVKEEIPRLNALIEREPRNVAAYRLRASHYLQLKEYEKVAADYSRIIELVPDDIESYLSRAQAYFDLELYDKALADADTVLKTESNNFNAYDAYLQRFLVYFKREQYEKAIATVTDILKFRPDDIWAYQTRSRLYKETKQYKKALADYTHLVKIDPQSAYVRYERAELYKIFGEKQKAAADIKAGDEIVKSEVISSYFLNTVHRRLRLGRSES